MRPSCFFIVAASMVAITSCAGTRADDAFERRVEQRRLALDEVATCIETVRARLDDALGDLHESLGMDPSAESLSLAIIARLGAEERAALHLGARASTLRTDPDGAATLSNEAEVMRVLRHEFWKAGICDREGRFGHLEIYLNQLSAQLASLGVDIERIHFTPSRSNVGRGAQENLLLSLVAAYRAAHAGPTQGGGSNPELHPDE